MHQQSEDRYRDKSSGSAGELSQPLLLSFEYLQLFRGDETTIFHNRFKDYCTDLSFVILKKIFRGSNVVMTPGESGGQGMDQRGHGNSLKLDNLLTPIHASVPELTNRTISMLGTALITISAKTFCRRHGAPSWSLSQLFQPRMQVNSESGQDDDRRFCKSNKWNFHLGEVFWFLERVAVRVAEEKGVVLCRREEEKKRRQTKGVEKKRRQKEKGVAVALCRREEEKEEEGCGCGFVQTEKKIRQKGEG
uniref:Uncharacterized protein n=1 Tax=Salix viminalis TaxID=40686 RepID=A0A6N2MF88_SALVM